MLYVTFSILQYLILRVGNGKHYRNIFTHQCLHEVYSLNVKIYSLFYNLKKVSIVTNFFKYVKVKLGVSVIGSMGNACLGRNNLTSGFLISLK